ncbi:hypothetical protein [Paraburkholderia sp. BCC1885]|uniref:hypothetical protein n=1 Tax=Paraburkholderia sp. BCC1885 TaxID=2562669 RepID=UPI001182B8CF|nr:hypothetical protein [Paraburkholderia sp. BCC1885]
MREAAATTSVIIRGDAQPFIGYNPGCLRLADHRSQRFDLPGPIRTIGFGFFLQVRQRLGLPGPLATVIPGFEHQPRQFLYLFAARQSIRQ